MNKAQLIELYTQDQRIEVEYPDMRREVTPQVVRHVDTSALGEGAVIYSQLDEVSADEVIRQQMDYFAGIGQGFEWKVYDYDRPADLKERLAAFGFEIEESEAIMALDLEHAPEFLWQPVQHDVRRIHTVDGLADVQSVKEAVWGDDSSWIADYLGGALTNYPDQMSVYVAKVDEQPASAAWIYFPKNSQFASLWGGSTISRYRKQGLYSALLAVRAQEARVRGVRFLTVDASDMSRPILQKLGFEMIAHSNPCKWKAPS
ncbi:MAG: hypothetical protein J5I90_14270 [Caldilineales bacterium]|nr:hypothetical protein [Caldilineales bacterium]